MAQIRFRQSESGNMNILIWDSNLARQCRDTAGNPGQSVTVENTFAPGDYYIRIAITVF